MLQETWTPMIVLQETKKKWKSYIESNNLQLTSYITQNEKSLLNIPDPEEQERHQKCLIQS